jgi:hypothetical protein
MYCSFVKVRSSFFYFLRIVKYVADLKVVYTVYIYVYNNYRYIIIYIYALCILFATPPEGP